MNLADYIKSAPLTEAPPTNMLKAVLDDLGFETLTSDGIYMGGPNERTIRIAHAVIGMNTESTEILEAYTAVVSGDQPLDLVNVVEELGDWSWYHALFCDIVGQELSGDVLVAGGVAQEVALLRFVASSGKLLDWVKKTLFYGKIISEEGLIADVNLSYANLRCLAFALGIDLDRVRKLNEDKLKLVRYKTGKFTEDEAATRDIDAERTALENTQQ